MRNLLLSLTLISLSLTGVRCIKNDDGCTPKTPASEAAQITSFAAANGIIATAHTSGLYYEIVNPGSGTTASLNSNIFITYTGTFLDGTTFDEQNNPGATGWPLNQLIEGWKVGIPLIQEGGRIKLIVPSSMAYGCTGYAGIAGNTVLFFDITLTDVQ